MHSSARGHVLYRWKQSPRRYPGAISLAMRRMYWFVTLFATTIVTGGVGAIAVHCKAGLGRTGCCIGAYLMKHFNLTAGTFPVPDPDPDRRSYGTMQRKPLAGCASFVPGASSVLSNTTCKISRRVCGKPAKCIERCIRIDCNFRPLRRGCRIFIRLSTLPRVVPPPRALQRCPRPSPSRCLVDCSRTPPAAH